MGIVDGWPLEIADESPRALRTAVQMLLDIEAIRRVKHAYFRCIDTETSPSSRACSIPT
jgi:hypothetical protein